jgi:type II secretory pathway component GspD/PulD (secretin)
VTFIDVGTQINVTPTINDDGFVTMKVKPEISSVTDFLTTPSGNKIPIVDSSLAETSVMVKDGVSIIIGGLRRDEKVTTHDKVPYLGDIPIIGAPFNNKTEKKLHTELLILITPHIVTGERLTTGEGISEGGADRRPGENPFMGYEDYGSSADVKKKTAVPPAVGA